MTKQATKARRALVASALADQQVFVKPRPPHNEFGPGSFATHEAQYMCAFLMRAVWTELGEHRAIENDPDLAAQIAKVWRAMNKLHLMIQKAKP